MKRGGGKKAISPRGTSPSVKEGASFGKAGNVKHAQSEQGRVKPALVNQTVKRGSNP